MENPLEIGQILIDKLYEEVANKTLDIIYDTERHWMGCPSNEKCPTGSMGCDTDCYRKGIVDRLAKETNTRIGLRPAEDFDRERFKEEAQGLITELSARRQHAIESGDDELGDILTNLIYGVWQYGGRIYNGIDKLKKKGG